MRDAREFFFDCDVSPDGTRLATEAVGPRDSTKSIFTVSIDGGKLKQITPGPLWDLFPRWSPDGKWIAFSRYDPKPNRRKLCVVPSEGGEVRELVVSDDSSGFSGYLTWSPEGKAIAYSSYHGDSLRGITLIPFEGGDPETIIELAPGSRCGGLGWSPDGRKLAYRSIFSERPSFAADIWVMEFDTKRSVRLSIGTDLDVMKGGPVWSPDGMKIAFTGGRSERSYLCIIKDFLPLSQSQSEPLGEAESKELTVRMVLSGPEAGAFEAPSSDGRYLSYLDWETGDLAVRELATGEIRHLTNEGTWKEPVQYAQDSRISPDGKQIAFSALKGQTEIWVMENFLPKD